MTAEADTELRSPPALGALYGRALLGAALPRGDALPGRGLVLRDVELERAHVAAYHRVCGFRLADRLPPTYLHVAAFPLAMALMTQRTFPFSVLGLIHVSNRIVQRRPLDVSERPALRVRTEDLRAHRRGRQFDVVTEASLDGEVVLVETSTYLRRGDGAEQPRDDGDRRPEPPAEVTARVRVPGDIGRRYAAVSGDRNPIHLRRLGARLFGVRGPIAHGMWMKARCLAAFEDVLAPAFEVEAWFRSPLRIPAEAGLASDRHGDGMDFALRGHDDRVHLTGTIRPLP